MKVWEYLYAHACISVYVYFVSEQLKREATLNLESLPLDLVSRPLTLFHSRKRSDWALKHFLNAWGFVSKHGSPLSSYTTFKQRSFPLNVLNNRFCAKRKSSQDWFWTNGKLVGFWMVRHCVRKTRFFFKDCIFFIKA